MEKLERTLNDVSSDLSKEPAEASEPKKVKKVAKDSKKAKKVAKKTDKPAKGEKKDTSDRILLADLASEAEVTTASARRRLRDADLSPEGRWSWEPGSKALKEARKVLGLDA